MELNVDFVPLIPIRNVLNIHIKMQLNFPV